MCVYVCMKRERGVEEDRESRRGTSIIIEEEVKNREKNVRRHDMSWKGEEGVDIANIV